MKKTEFTLKIALNSIVVTSEIKRAQEVGWCHVI